jgi:hypothetical protein
MVPTQIMLLGALAVLMTGCVSTMHARDVQPHGLISEHQALLTDVTDDRAALKGYRNPAANWRAYDKILLEPVVISDDFVSTLNTEQRGDLKKLTESFYAKLRQNLSKQYQITDAPAAGTMRYRVSITHAEQSWMTLAVLTKAVWQLQAANTLWALTGGKPAFAGEVTAEFTITDAVTGELLEVGVDRRVGGQNLLDREAFNSWGDVKNSLNYWADSSAYRLCSTRGDADCVEPKAGWMDILHF